MQTAGIYAIKVWGKKKTLLGTYYGQAANIQKRWTTHRRKMALHPNIKLRRLALEGRLEFVILEVEDDPALRLAKEIAYIAGDENSLNIRSAGKGIKITLSTMLPKQKYCNRYLYLKRDVPNLCKVYTLPEKHLLGVEFVEAHFPLGTFFCDESFNLVRKK